MNPDALNKNKLFRTIAVIDESDTELDYGPLEQQMAALNACSNLLIELGYAVYRQGYKATSLVNSDGNKIDLRIEEF